ncbi:hypothetical protein F8388_022989 [Cannabis sativa]|uniref:RNase H type-1 domain-containing protein n=1 Tax=Cannabis sativa TaxID=3483 RepID=A0A7J6E7D1_CANSA|nr:hypothetical protein F8388_022989 [Cannabis sativa]
MALDTCCDWCKNQEEDICHALWLCPKVQNVWKKLGFSKLIPPDVHKAADVLWWLLDHLPKDDLIRVMGLSWLVWQRRNSFVFQHKARPLMDQLGVGSSCFASGAKPAVVAEVELILGCLSVLLVEAAAILLGVKLALRWPISNAQVGSDSQSIVKALKVTNSLAKWSRLTQKSDVWTDMLPNCAVALLLADVPSVAQ